MAFNELLRLYTPEGKPTDTFKQRGEVHRDGDWHATVHLWVINPVGELLFQKRADTTELNPGLWDVSAAGHIVNDDSRELSLEREAHEELGLSIEAREATWLFTLRTDSHSSGLHERVFQYIYLLEADVDIAGLTPQSEEVAAVAWHHYSVLGQLTKDCSGFVPRIDEYRQLLAYLENTGPR